MERPASALHPSVKVFFLLVDFAEMLSNKQSSTTLRLNPFLSPRPLTLLLERLESFHWSWLGTCTGALQQEASRLGPATRSSGRSKTQHLLQHSYG